MTERPDPNLVRLCCDGEATPEEAAQLRQYMTAHPDCCREIESQMECERKLRQSIRALMSECPCAPAELRECLCQILRGESAAVEAEIAGRIQPQASARQRQSALRSFFSNTQSANWIAVAATLMLIVGAVLFGIFGRTIDDVRPGASPDLVSDAALYADQEHREWASGKRVAMNSANPVRVETRDAERYLGQWLDTPVRVFDLSEAGYEFIGAERGLMPFGARAGHMVYKRIAGLGERRPMLSVFVVHDQGQCRGKLCENQQSGTWCCITGSNTKCKKKVLRGTDGKLVYFVVCCDDKAVESLAQSLQLASAHPATR
jgi:anti-sigma factor RsiW